MPVVSNVARIAAPIAPSGEASSARAVRGGGAKRQGRKEADSPKRVQRQHRVRTGTSLPIAEETRSRPRALSLHSPLRAKPPGRLECPVSPARPPRLASLKDFVETMALAEITGPGEIVRRQTGRTSASESRVRARTGYRCRYPVIPSSLNQHDALCETLKVDSLSPSRREGQSGAFASYTRRLQSFCSQILVSISAKPLAGALVIVAVLLVPLYWLGQIFGLLWVTFTQIEMNPPAPGSNGHSIRILKDKDHDEILAEVMRRWKARMAPLYGNVNLQADVERETRKFEWLRQRGVIDEERFQRALRILSANKARPSEGRGLN